MYSNILCIPPYSAIFPHVLLVLRPGTIGRSENVVLRPQSCEGRGWSPEELTIGDFKHQEEGDIDGILMGFNRDIMAY